MYYGGQNAAELLTQFDDLRAGRTYEAILVLTDGSGYELGEGNVAVPVPAAPVWMVHLGGDFSLGYDDPTLEAIQASGGGAAGSLTEALTRLQVALAADQAAPAIADVIDGYVWQVMPSQTVDSSVAASADFAPFAARRLILAEVYRRRDALNQLHTLDYLHALATEHNLVSPYSSMIVLVNAEQQKLLDELERRQDRFQREYEEVGETAPQNPFSITGVPEPHEWVLLTLAALMLGWWSLKHRWSFRSHPADYS